jgi:very-short-patch-repair endonuclease
MGKNETVLLDLQEKKDGTKIKRQYIVNELGYVVDGYCPETNTIYEVYEHKHRHTRDMLKDIQREKEIREFLGCSFVVIWDE